MQLFCFIKDLKQFETFPRVKILFVLVSLQKFLFRRFQSFISMFQVLTQKGWVDVMHYTMFHSIQDLAPFVAIYFIVYHLAINLVSQKEKQRSFSP